VSVFMKMDKRGFLLLEVIMSVLIIASGVMFVIKSYSTSLKGANISQAMTRACFLAEDKLFELEYKGFRDGIPEGESNDSIEGEPYYRCGVNSWTVEDKDDPKISRVALTVYYTKGTQSRSLVVQTFLKHSEG